MSTVRYVIARHVGDHDEFLNEDGFFGPLTDHHRDRNVRVRRDVTRVFYDESHARVVIKAWEQKHPTTAHFASLEARRLP